MTRVIREKELTAIENLLHFAKKKKKLQMIFWRGLVCCLVNVFAIGNEEDDCNESR